MLVGMNVVNLPDPLQSLYRRQERKQSRGKEARGPSDRLSFPYDPTPYTTEVNRRELGAYPFKCAILLLFYTQ